MKINLGGPAGRIRITLAGLSDRPQLNKCNAMNRYNEARALARKVDDFLRSPGMWGRFAQELKRFREWQTRWEQENAERLQECSRWTELASQTLASDKTGLPQELRDLFERAKQDLIPRVQRVQQAYRTDHPSEGPEAAPRLNDGDVWACVRQTLDARVRELKPTEASPWERLLAVLRESESETEHLTEMIEFFVPTEGFLLTDHADALCLHCVRLAILHDMALRGDGAMVSITAGILDPEDAETAYEEMTHRDRGGDAWDKWRPAIEGALEAVKFEATVPDKTPPTQDKPNLDELPDTTTFSPKDLADLTGINREVLRKRLERLRGSQDDCFIENTDRKRDEPQFLYKLGPIRPLIRELQAKYSLSRSCPPLK